jgi:hypothetical protein
MAVFFYLWRLFAAAGGILKNTHLLEMYLEHGNSSRGYSGNP